MTLDDLKDLHRRMIRHTDVNDMVVCVLTARELQQLLELAERALDENKKLSRKGED